MRRLICFFCAVAVCFSLMAIPAFADEITEETVPVTEAVEQETIDEVAEEVAEDTVDEAYTLIGRIQEYITKYTGEILTTGGDVVLLGAYAVYFVLDKRKSKDVKATLETIAGNTGNVAVSQGGVVEVANNLIDGYNAASAKIAEMMATYSTFEEREENRDRLVAALLVQNEAIMEILQTAYANSQLPQGTKDLVIFKYARCLSLTNDNEKLDAIMHNIRFELTPAEMGEEEAMEQCEEAEEVEA